ncbi:MAG: DUF2254 family protein [Polyangiaceae bacterium]
MARPSFRRTWLYPMGALAFIAIAIVATLYAIDVHWTGGPADKTGRTYQFFFFDDKTITDAVSGLGAMVAGVLGLVVSVVSIIVQLSAERYTGVTAMFLKDRTNISVMAFYVIACVCGVWVSLSVRESFVPRLTVTFMLCTVMLALVLMAPYFAYVFRFLEPSRIVHRIQSEASRTAARGARAGGEASEAAQAVTLGAMEELTDITSNSISGKDKIIASNAVDALKDLALRYIALKKDVQPEWFAIGAAIRDNPDFVAMDPESLDDLEKLRTWFEWKIMRQYLGIYNEALGQMRDIAYLIAIDTRYIGEAAADKKDKAVVALVFRYMNSYIRATLNAKDVRTAYNVFNQYRKLVEAMLKKGMADEAVTAVGYMRYYAHVSYDLKLSFVTETIAYDVSSICQLANELGVPEEEQILKAFLDLDRPTFERAQENALKGVRKAQVKLASYYMSKKSAERARLIRDDMMHEPRERLRAIRDELVRVESKDFWEINDRGRNFEFMPEPQRSAMIEFFKGFEDLDADPRASSAGAEPAKSA